MIKDSRTRVMDQWEIDFNNQAVLIEAAMTVSPEIGIFQDTVIDRTENLDSLDKTSIAPWRKERRTGTTRSREIDSEVALKMSTAISKTIECRLDSARTLISPIDRTVDMIEEMIRMSPITVTVTATATLVSSAPPNHSLTTIIVQ